MEFGTLITSEVAIEMTTQTGKIRKTSPPICSGK
jgi:hypothetical protein